MASKFFRYTLAAGLSTFIFFGNGAALAGPVELPPAERDGEIQPYSRVKKHGVIWYPASLVGHHRGINFSYDYATRKLYADGVETFIPCVVVDDVVYVNMTPQATQQDMRPGMSYLQARREELRALEGASSHMSGNADARLMSGNISAQAHPWAQQPGEDQSPLIDLDPSQEAQMAPHMQPGARPPEAPPAALPSRLPNPGAAMSPATNPAQPVPTVVVPPTRMPAAVTTQGGPGQTALIPDPNGLQPIPAPVAPVKSNKSAFSTSGELRSTSGQNSVFKVQILSGTWEAAEKGNLLRVKLSQVNASPVAQSNLGTFSVRCADGTRVEASRTRSYLPDGTLGPGSLREADLSFRFSQQQEPRTLELEGALPLSVTLQRAP